MWERRVRQHHTHHDCYIQQNVQPSLCLLLLGSGAGGRAGRQGGCQDAGRGRRADSGCCTPGWACHAAEPAGRPAAALPRCPAGGEMSHGQHGRLAKQQTTAAANHHRRRRCRRCCCQPLLPPHLLQLLLALQAAQAPHGIRPVAQVDQLVQQEEEVLGQHPQLAAAGRGRQAGRARRLAGAPRSCAGTPAAAPAAWRKASWVPQARNNVHSMHSSSRVLTAGGRGGTASRS